MLAVKLKSIKSVIVAPACFACSMTLSTSALLPTLCPHVNSAGLGAVNVTFVSCAMFLRSQSMILFGADTPGTSKTPMDTYGKSFGIRTGI